MIHTNEYEYNEYCYIQYKYNEGSEGESSKLFGISANAYSWYISICIIILLFLVIIVIINKRMKFNILKRKTIPVSVSMGKIEQEIDELKEIVNDMEKKLENVIKRIDENTSDRDRAKISSGGSPGLFSCTNQNCSYKTANPEEIYCGICGSPLQDTT